MRYVNFMRSQAFRGLAAAIGFAFTANLAQAVEPDGNSVGSVYVMSNQATANSVLAYSRDAHGTLTYVGTYATGGKGAGTGADPLGSQGALTLGSGFLFAVNAGSNDVSMFAIDGTKLTLLDRESSGGQMPVSVTVKGFIAYVVNAGGTPDISGFAIDPIGKRLIPLPGSQRPLAGGTSAQPAQIRFDPDGDELLVTEKGTQLIDSWKINPFGYASRATRNASTGVTPFGFSITNRGYAIVSEAGSGSVSSYETNEAGPLDPLSRSTPLGQKAPCWLVTTGDGRYAYTANAGSGTISSLAIASDGQVRVLNPAAGIATAPLDLALSRNSRFLYVREGTGAVTGFRVAPDGSLSSVGTVTGVPAGAQGIAAR